MCDDIDNFEKFKLKALDKLKLTSLLQIDELELICKICSTLKEKNIQLIERVVHRKGTQFCQKILDLTLERLADGGQYTHNGEKRTPGGVFLNILKKHLDKNEIKFIWSEQVRRQRMIKRERKRLQNKLDA